MAPSPSLPTTMPRCRAASMQAAPGQALGVEPAGPPTLERLAGLPEALALMEAALSQNTHLPQLLAYRGMCPPEPAAAARNHSGSSSGAASGAGAFGAHASQGQGITNSTYRDSLAGSAASTGKSELLAAEASGSTAAGALSHQASRLLGQGSLTGGELGPVAAEQSSRRSTLQRELSRRPSSLRSLASTRSVRAGGAQLPAAQLEPLWCWSCPATEGMAATCLAWNKAKPDLLAAGYTPTAQQRARSAGSTGGAGSGSTARSSTGGKAGASSAGLVAVWSLKNTCHPLWSFATKSGVTSLDWSGRQPNLIAVGLANGSVALHDARQRQEEPRVESTAASGSHSDPVWRLRWLDRGPQRDEVLISISSDGRLVQWEITKGLETSQLMQLKRLARSTPGAAAQAAAAAAAAAVGGAGGSAGSKAIEKAAERAAEGRDPLISRHTGGMSFAFSPEDCRVYLAGTDDGWVHRCNTSYSEQYLESFPAHLGPVYALAWSPFKPGLFLSCGADWCCRLWQLGRRSPLLACQAGTTEVNDVAWCPSNATAFAAVAGCGRLELWDLEVSSLRPVAAAAPGGAKMRCVLFAEGGAPVVVAGSEAGGVHVYRMAGVALEGDEAAREEQVRRLEAALEAHVLKVVAPSGGGAAASGTAAGPAGEAADG